MVLRLIICIYLPVQISISSSPCSPRISMASPAIRFATMPVLSSSIAAVSITTPRRSRFSAACQFRAPGRPTCALLTGDAACFSPRFGSGGMRFGRLVGFRDGHGTVMALVEPGNRQTLFCIISLCAALSQMLENRTKWGAQISAPLLAMGSGMLLSGAQIIPNTSSTYDFVSVLVMPVALSLCLLETDVQRAFVDAGSTLKAFWYGVLGTILGTLLSFRLVGHALGANGWKIASSLCASYIGGGINYVATAQALGLNSASTLAAGMAADNLAMAFYFAVIMSIPDNSQRDYIDLDDMLSPENYTKPTVETMGLSLASAAAACTIGNSLASMAPSSFAGCGLALVALVSSFFSAIAARISGVSRNATVRIFAGSETLGATLMLFFFTVVGTSAGFQEAFSGGWPLFVFISILIIVHMGVILSLGCWSQLPMRTVLIASNANIGGPATAAAMANCRCWRSLVRPALLVGTLGYTIGTTIGCLVGMHFLQPMS